jgi:urease accessory protein
LTPETLLTLLHVNDSLFPTGGFAYSDGLETAVTNGLVDGAVSLQEWMQHYVDHVFVPCDGLAAKLAMNLHKQNNWPALQELDEELTALKPSAAVRASSRTQGKMFLKSIAGIHHHSDFEGATRDYSNLPILYGIVGSVFGFVPRDALLSFAYMRLAGTASASLRLMSIGQGEVHAVLHRVLQTVPVAVDKIINSSEVGLTCFAPMMDIQQMNHRQVYSRLFRS